MNPFDIYATKGIEYLVVIAFLAVLVLYWRLLRRAPGAAREVAEPVARLAAAAGGWFAAPAELRYHPGHSWAARDDGEDILAVGIDDFAQRLLGPVEGVRLPAVGSRLEQGSVGWTVEVAGEAFDVLAPVDGEVVAVNGAALTDPSVLNRDPYDRGWLVKVKAPRAECNLRTLLDGEVARRWMESLEQRLRMEVAGDLGMVLADGGEPVSGLARAMTPETWADTVREYLLTR